MYSLNWIMYVSFQRLHLLKTITFKQFYLIKSMDALLEIVGRENLSRMSPIKFFLIWWVKINLVIRIHWSSENTVLPTELGITSITHWICCILTSTHSGEQAKSTHRFGSFSMNRQLIIAKHWLVDYSAVEPLNL